MSDSSPTPEVLSAFIDGELSPREMTRIEVLLAQDSQLRGYVERQQVLREAMSAALAPTLQAPIPDHLQDIVANAPIGWQARAHMLSLRWKNSWSWRAAIPAGVALALCLVIGIALERPGGRLQTIQTVTGGQLLASRALSGVLDKQLASDQDGANSVQVGLSFRNKSGQDCRTFALAGETLSSTGIACRSGDSWVIATIVSTPGTSHTPYAMAGAQMPDVIRRAVEAMIVGEPFDASAERAARARAWQEVTAH